MPIEETVVRAGRALAAAGGDIDTGGLDADEVAKVAEYVAFLKEHRRAKLIPPPEPPEVHSKKVLIIDDDQEICELLHMFLSNYRYKTFLAFNARMGLEYFKEARPDIVFLDLKMPDMDGVDVLKVMRDIRSTPTVIITGHPEFISDVQAAGIAVEGYLEKPLVLEKVLRMLRRTLGNDDARQEKA